MPTRERAKQEFAKRLRKMMLDRGWSQSELSRRAGIGRDSVSCYIRAINLPEGPAIRKLAKALSVEEEDLLPSSINPAMAAFGDGVNGEEDTILKSVGGDQYYLRVGKTMSLDQALRIMEILKEEESKKEG